MSLKPLLLLAYYYPPWNTSGVQRAVRIARYMPEAGYEPYVICSSESGTLSGVPRVEHVPNAATEARAGGSSRWAARIQRAALPYNEQLPWVPHAIAAAEVFLKNAPAASMISTSPPVATHLAAYRLKQRHPQVKWLADFRDPLLGNPGRSRKWARPYDAAIQRRILSSCDAAMAVTDVIVEEWGRRHPKWVEKFHTVWNGFDPEEEYTALPIEPSPVKTLLHAGVVYHQRHPFWLADSLDRLISGGRLDPAKIRLRLLGTLQERELFSRHPSVAALLARKCLECDGQVVPREEAMRAVASTDYLLILDIANLSDIGYTVPAKLYDNIRIGRPILLYTPSIQSPTARILQQSGVPQAIVQAGDGPDVVDRKVFEFFQLPNEPQRPSAWFTQNFDGRQQVHMMASILDRLKPAR